MVELFDDIDLNIGFSEECDSLDSENVKNDVPTKGISHRRKTKCVEISTKHLYRRGFSESRILEAMKLEKLKNGYSYHFISAGDADSLSFLKVVLENIGNLDYLLISTWVMNAEDILQIREWIDAGVLHEVDIYVGEIFPNSYKIEWEMLQRLVEETKCGRLCYFRNHSKVFAGRGGDLAFAIESSANINTNPRTEQTTITLDKGLFEFYKNYFDGINSF